MTPCQREFVSRHGSIGNCPDWLPSVHGGVLRLHKTGLGPGLVVAQPLPSVLQGEE